MQILIIFLSIRFRSLLSMVIRMELAGAIRTIKFMPVASTKSKSNQNKKERKTFHCGLS